MVVIIQDFIFEKEKKEKKEKKSVKSGETLHQHKWPHDWMGIGVDMRVN